MHLTKPSIDDFPLSYKSHTTDKVLTGKHTVLYWVYRLCNDSSCHVWYAAIHDSTELESWNIITETSPELGGAISYSQMSQNIPHIIVLLTHGLVNPSKS